MLADFRLPHAADENMSSHHSSEDNDVMLCEPSEERPPFRQIDYLWLFNPFYKFSDRAHFTLEDSSLSLDDYSSMRYMNRNLLTQYLQECQNSGVKAAGTVFANFKVQDGEQNWADEFLDEEVKRVLAVRQHGAFLSVDITAHMEYFYNTLECDNRTQNPFFFAKNYPAL